MVLLTQHFLYSLYLRMKIQPGNRLPPIPQSLLNYSNTSSLPIICTHCNLGFSNERDLNDHLSESSVNPVDKDGIIETLASTQTDYYEARLPDPVIPDDEQTREFLCSMCNSTFRNYKGMRQHIGKVHMTQVSHCICSACGKTYKHKYALKFHKIQVHERATRVTCPYCIKTLYNKYMLSKHIQKNHRT
jgi:DNA-directed RNA polymerase subunit M/transcription elongation factor TFIIS